MSKQAVESATGYFRAGKHLVYTAIIGDYDSLKRPLWTPENVDYVALLSNSNSRHKNGWLVVDAPTDNIGPKQMNRKLKILGFKYTGHYDSVIYVDGSIQIVRSFESEISAFLESHSAIGVFSHDERKNPWEEVSACIEQGLISSQGAEFELERLSTFENHNPRLGLFDAGVVFKNPQNQFLRSLEMEWFRLYSQNPERDQLSLPIVVANNFSQVRVWEHWRKIAFPPFLRFPHRDSGTRLVRLIFILGGFAPALFSRLPGIRSRATASTSRNDILSFRVRVRRRTTQA